MSEEKNDGTEISEEGLKHFEHLASQLSKARAGGEGAKVGIGDLCRQYHKIAPTLKKVLPFIRFIPKIGKTAAEAIEFLMVIADMTCPVE